MLSRSAGPTRRAAVTVRSGPLGLIRVTRRKEQVRRFYEVLWEAHDTEAIPTVLHENFTFRGSLGQEKSGHDGFAGYVAMVHNALADYRCTIEELVAEG